MCAHGATGQAANGSATRKIQGTRQGDFRRKKMSPQKMLIIFAMNNRHLAVMKTARVNILLHFNSFSILDWTNWFILEPFIFGPWEDTNVCTESCRLLQRRTCKEVNQRSFCKDQLIERVGETVCLSPPCKGRILYSYLYLMS